MHKIGNDCTIIYHLPFIIYISNIILYNKQFGNVASDFALRRVYTSLKDQNHVIFYFGTYPKR